MKNVKPDSRHKIRIITYGDFIDLLHTKDVFEKLEKIAGKVSKKIFELFTSSSSSTEWVAFGGTSAGPNPGNDVAYIYIFGDWLNGEFTSFLQYMYYNRDPYADFINPGRKGYKIKAKDGKTSVEGLHIGSSERGRTETILYDKELSSFSEAIQELRNEGY